MQTSTCIAFYLAFFGFGFIILLGLTACSKTDNEASKASSQAKPAQTLQDALKIGGTGPTMVVIPVGEGVIGNYSGGKADINELPVMTVKSEVLFAMSATEITFEDYDKFCQTISRPCPDDKGWGRGKQPVINVSWRDAQMYTKWLSKQTGQEYSLPSEAQWEYAARGGTRTRFWWGNEYVQGLDHCDKDIGGCPEGTALFHPGPVGNFQPNPFGLYDMTSNVGEWTLDCWNEQHDKNKTDLSPRLTGNCEARVVKGGAHYEKSTFVHLSMRIKISDITYKVSDLGFRVVRSIKNQ